MKIPKHWTFKNSHVAKSFDKHVREQLPWYDLVTDAIVHLGRHYIPDGGLVYDIGASTGNIGKALAETISIRKANIVAIEESSEMASLYKGGGQLEVCNALEFEFQNFDFAVCCLTMMFFPVAKRGLWLKKMISLIRPGGALVIVDKMVVPSGYSGTVLRRMAMQWKVAGGASPSEVIQKELSLAGYQRPISESVFIHGTVFFRLGEFAGWLFESPEAW